MIIVFYSKQTQEVYRWCRYSDDFIIEGDTVRSPQLTMTGVDWDKVGYGFYEDKVIERQYDEDGNELPLYLADLNLSPPTPFSLPKSMHIAALTAVDTVNKKGTVVRKWHGENYTYEGCYCSLQALEAYAAGKIKLFDTSKGINAPENADSFVLVYFVSENPYDEALEIPVIMDKLVK